jgi:formyl-CoA transferase
VINIANLLGEDADDYATPAQQSERVPELDALLSQWIGERTLDDAVKAMQECAVVAAPVLTGTDILDDPMYLERGNVVEIADDDLGTVRMQGVIPRLIEQPGAVWRTGASLGADTELVLRDYLGHSAEEIGVWRAAGVI